VTDMARERASSLVNQGRDLVQPPLQAVANKSLDLVQPPIDATKEATKSLARKTYERTSDVAIQGFNMASSRLVPIVTPYAKRAKEYLPEQTKTFIEQNVEGKSIDELGNTALLVTRKNLLGVKKEKSPTVMALVTEVKDATLSGDLFKNALSLSERAANSLFGETKIPTNASSFRRMYNLSTKITFGIRDYTTKQLDMAKQQTMNMATKRANQVRDFVSPYVKQIGETPVIPSFVFRLLRQPVEEVEEQSSTTVQKKTATLPTTTVRVDIVGMQPSEMPQATTTSLKTAATASTNKTSSTVASTELKDASKESGNTASISGTGPETEKTGEIEETFEESHDEKHSKKKKHHKM